MVNKGPKAKAAVPLPDAKLVRTTQRDLVAWFVRHKRDLPWRRTNDPYAIWVSEIMLQQTQVATVLDYYRRWMKRFPTVAELARADEADVLHAWQGLGYYSRARTLKRAATLVVQDHQGQLPDNVESLLTLPGVGPYSAGAIASIAYGRRAPLVDGNVIRVLCRYLGLRGDPAKSPLKTGLWAIAERLLPESDAGTFNQALMELGATRCTPKSPLCGECPLSKNCVAKRSDLTGELPELAKRPKVTRERHVAAVIERRGRFLLVQRSAEASRWASMWQFPNVVAKPKEAIESAASRAALEQTGLEVATEQALSPIVHSVTRYRITLEPLRCRSESGRPRPGANLQQLRWFEPRQFASVPLPSAHQQIVRHLARD
jgi:A/G-specific adenine glycosylase